MQRIVIADTYPMLRAGTRLVLERGDYQVIAQCTRGDTLLERSLALVPDLVITEISLPVLSGLEVTALIRQRLPAVPVLIYSRFPEQRQLLAAITAGARGYLHKSVPATEFCAAVAQLLAGFAHLSANGVRVLDETRNNGRVACALTALPLLSRQILVLTLRGYTIQQIATLTGRSRSAIVHHQQRIYTRLGTDDRPRLHALALAQGLLDMP